MRSATVRDEDLTARARIREAALELFARDGFEATSVRAIASAAGVSPALVMHHFGSKDDLRAAVDASLVATFEGRLQEIPHDLPTDRLSAAWGEVFAEVVGPNPVLRAYLRRSLLEGSEAATALLDRLFEYAQAGLEVLEEAGAVRPETDPEWRAYQVLFITFGPLLFESLLKRRLAEPFADSVVRRRSASNHDVICHGLLR